jgi:hypothetical protein
VCKGDPELILAVSDLGLCTLVDPAIQELSVLGGDCHLVFSSAHFAVDYSVGISEEHWHVFD